MKTPRLTAAFALFAGALLSWPMTARQATAAPKTTPSPAADGHHDRQPQDIFRVKPLSGNVYALYGRGGNVGFFVGPDAVLVIDSQFKELAPGIVAEIKKVTDKPIKFLMNTHHHLDHVGGNEVFKQFAMIVAHDNVRKHMLVSPTAVLRDFPAILETARKSGDEETARIAADQIEWAKTVKVEEIPAPIMTFDSELRIYMGDETIQVWHLPPAHTDGDSVVYFEKAKVLHTGDDGFNRVIPVIDIKAGGSVKGFLPAIDKVLARVPADAAVIPGHGEVMDVAGLKAFRQYIVDLMDAAQKARAAGRSREDFVNSVDLPAYREFEGYPKRFRSNAGAAYDEAR